MTAGVNFLDDPRLPDALERLRAPGGYEAFEAQVRCARFCRRPVRLTGSVVRVSEDGGRTTLFDSRSQPDGVLLKACGTRRQTLCPPCESIYRGDAFALVAAGPRGGKGIPQDVTEHPAALLTLTAPSFGPVQAQKGRNVSPLRIEVPSWEDIEVPETPRRQRPGAR